MPPPGSQANLLTVVNGKDANGPCVCCCIYKCGRTHAVHVSMVQWFFPKINKWSWRTRIIHSFSGIANRFQRIIAKGQSTPWYVPIFFFVLLIPWIQWYLKKFHIETRSVTALKFLRCPSIIFARNLGLNRYILRQPARIIAQRQTTAVNAVNTASSSNSPSSHYRERAEQLLSIMSKLNVDGRVATKFFRKRETVKRRLTFDPAVTGKRKFCPSFQKMIDKFWHEFPSFISQVIIQIPLKHDLPLNFIIKWFIEPKGKERLASRMIEEEKKKEKRSNFENQSRYHWWMLHKSKTTYCRSWYTRVSVTRWSIDRDHTHTSPRFRTHRCDS